jgi:hypothetical protein
MKARERLTAETGSLVAQSRAACQMIVWLEEQRLHLKCFEKKKKDIKPALSEQVRQKFDFMMKRIIGKHNVVASLRLQNYNFACCFVWVRNVVADIEGRT